jgi:uncharacterized phage protein (TIGR01671 family)
MSREIKFRAWHTRKKAMMFFELDELNDSMITKVEDGWYLEDCELMQFTGYKDRDGKDIYDGDILQDWRGVRQEAFSFVDAYHVLSGWTLRPIKEPDALLGGFAVTHPSWLQVVEVIGNRYEHPELLEVSGGGSGTTPDFGNHANDTKPS